MRFVQRWLTSLAVRLTILVGLLGVLSAGAVGLAVGKLVRQRAGAQVAGVDERHAPVDRHQALVVDRQHVARLSPAHADGPDDRVRALARVVAAQLRQLVDRDPGLGAVQEVRPGVGVDDHVA